MWHSKCLLKVDKKYSTTLQSPININYFMVSTFDLLIIIDVTTKIIHELPMTSNTDFMEQ